MSLEAVNLSCVRRDRVLFEQQSFTLNAGELTYLLGENGAGKTSLLRILIGFVEPAAGQVLYGGSAITHSDVRRKFNAELIYIGHKSAVDPHASAFENSRFWCAQHGVSVTQELIYSVLATLGLVGLEDIPCGQLSAGQNRRVALARLWFKATAKVWVLDEPFTALDVKGIELLERHIEAFLARGGSVILTSHQPLSHLTGWRPLELEYRL
ncbi:cytochrome c biogenesis heme-transporting ATPase CcmA [Alteromonas sp. ASW11-36]|uniref:Cytochrome c biogenesis heme-transporting ATPase CcmA n=1 Tax=Alteromonas arenosi TaxID=3055817 RepID=A0ABT7T0I1_9ALTE|nr:cytochrome c biogenesis heme-transporting ATPase CcmA [Alteromonas sp. ASW11-36]MDM7861956.1 cytochrome c biogenesis heme-transporting ATPase CcmA [Alteromonas sp. ASW11-36]